MNDLLVVARTETGLHPKSTAVERRKIFFFFSNFLIFSFFFFFLIFGCVESSFLCEGFL